MLAGGEPAEYLRPRFEPRDSLLEPVLEERRVRWSGAVEILDVGAGPISALGTPPAGSSITAVDPLADDYDALLAEVGIEPPIRTIPCAGEEILERFGPASFQAAYGRNSIDHALDPVRVIRNMLAVVRPGGSVVLRHRRNEGRTRRWLDFHQWNFDVRDGELVLWGRRESHRIGELIEPRDSLSCWLEPAPDGLDPWVVAAIDKGEGGSG
jgi:SAM-dependent methyltransferase